jgi:DNA invertase Pin-like site-specific DNA recombinase
VRAGLTSARERGRLGGRPKALSPTQIEAAETLVASKKFTFTDIANQVGVNRTTFYRALNGKGKKIEAEP